MFVVLFSIIFLLLVNNPPETFMAGGDKNVQVSMLYSFSFVNWISHKRSCRSREY
jgi:hypothetical protein